MTFRAVVLLTCTAAGLGLEGCTLFPEQKSPTLAQTTSAEQTERIFWQMARKQEWAQLQPLLAPNLVWTLPGRTLTRDEIVPYLQGLNVSDFAMTDVTVKPNGPDMTVTYTMQLPAGSGPGVRSGGSGGTSLGTFRTIRVVSVWQQVKSGYIMTVRSEQPTA